MPYKHIYLDKIAKFKSLDICLVYISFINFLSSLTFVWFTLSFINLFFFDICLVYIILYQYVFP